MIGRQFCGPPNSGNGGYVCGVLAGDLHGPVTSMLRAPVPLDTDLTLEARDGGWILSDDGGVLIGQGAPASQALPEPPLVPTLTAAREASAGYIGHSQQIHPPCFTCSTSREEGDALRIFPGQLAGADKGVVACSWTPHTAFSDASGVVAPEVVWAALDCPGFIAWVEKEGRHGALLGTMTGEIVAPVRTGVDYVVLAWPILREGRKEIAGVALFDTEGRLMARAHQIWIMMPPRVPVATAVRASATA